jgi:hypothetical protein
VKKTMKKLVLDLDAISVESFPTQHTAGVVRGTVQARSETIVPTADESCTTGCRISCNYPCETEFC